MFNQIKGLLKKPAKETLADHIKFDPQGGADSNFYLVLGNIESRRVFIDRMLKKIFQAKRAAIIQDPRAFYFKRRVTLNDYLFNVTDGRSAAWNPFSEIEFPSQAVALTECFFPDIEHQGFTDSKCLVSSIIKTLKENHLLSVSNFLHCIKEMNATDLKVLLIETQAKRLVQNENWAKKLIELRKIIEPRFIGYENIQIHDDQLYMSDMASLRDVDARVFLTYMPNKEELWKQINNAFLAVTIKELRDASNRQEHQGNRIWIILDGITDAGYIHGLLPLIAELDKLNIGLILGTNKLSNIDATYGHGAAMKMIAKADNVIVAGDYDERMGLLEYVSVSSSVFTNLDESESILLRLDKAIVKPTPELEEKSKVIDGFEDRGKDQAYITAKPSAGLKSFIAELKAR